MFPAAPGRLSITSVVPNAAPSLSEIRRATMSLVAPGADGSTQRMALDGYCCAHPMFVHRAATMQKAALVVFIIYFSSQNFFTIAYDAFTACFSSCGQFSGSSIFLPTG